MGSSTPFDQASPTPDASTHQWYLPVSTRNQVLEIFQHLRDPIDLYFFAIPGEEGGPYAQYMRRFGADMQILAAGKLHFIEKTPDSEEAKRFDVSTVPCLLVQPDTYSIRFLGAPAGEEGRVLMEALVMASTKSTRLEQASKQALTQLQEARLVQVFVSPTCPYCPSQAIHALRAATQRPDLIRAEVIDIQQCPDLAKKAGVSSVPHTIINEQMALVGLESEAVFIDELVTLIAHQEDLSTTPDANESAITASADLIIIGAGPAGLTAAMYAGRAGLSAIVLEKDTLGGQVSLTPKVENYPGILEVPGLALSSMMAEQANRYASVKTGESVEEIKIGRRVEVLTESSHYEGKAVLLATGASWKKLGAPGEEALYGKGVSYCSTCDGFLYKGRSVLVVGGGNTALTDAVHLAGLGAKVSLAHRRQEFRAEDYLQKSLASAGVKTYLGYTVEEILGKDKVESVRLRSLTDNSHLELAVDGVFMAIGTSANTQLAKQLGLRLKEDGTIWVDRQMRTSIKRIYAAGDVTGGARQIATATGQGAMAIMTIFEDLKRLEQATD